MEEWRNQKKSQEYGNLGGFSPIIDETGKITGYMTTIGGADTVFPFSEIDKEQLIIALANSNLGLNMESTPEQIYTALFNRFPGGREFIISCSGSYTNTGGNNSYADSTKYSVSGNKLTATMSSYGYGVDNGWKQTVNTNKVDISKYYTLEIKGSVSIVPYPGKSQNSSAYIYLCNSSGAIVKTIANTSNSNITINTTIDIEALKGDHFIKIVNNEVGDLITTIISSAYLS